MFPQLNKQSEDLIKTNIAKLAEVFPLCVKEGVVDFEVLNALLGGENLTNGGGRTLQFYLGR